jgi:hypothetical protein
MLKIIRLKLISVLLIFSFSLYYSPNLLKADAQIGSLAGQVYGKDGITPVEGALVRIKNVEDGTLYQSSESDSQGEFKISRIKEGIYVAGITTSEGNFNFTNLIGIKKGKDAKISFSLVHSTKIRAEPAQFESKELPILSETWVGKVVEYIPESSEAAVLIEEGILRLGDSIRFKGEVIDFYQEVESMRIGSNQVESANAGQTPFVKVMGPVQQIDDVYLVKKRKKFFLLSPIGIATVLSATSGVVYGVVKLTEDEPDVSPYKK